MIRRLGALTALSVALAAACSIYGNGEDNDDHSPPPIPAADASESGASDALDATVSDGPFVEVVDPSGIPDATDDAGPIIDAQPDMATPSLPALYVFISSAQVSGKMVATLGLAETFVDDLCKNLAAQSSYTGRKFKAGMSFPGSTINARIIARTVGYRFIDSGGKHIADNAETMVTAGLLNAVLFDEKGGGYATPEVWTGAASDGEASGETCSNWTTDATDKKGAGALVTSGKGWLNNLSTNCGSPRHIYCFEVP